MKCLYCNKDGEGIFCNSCGKEYVDTNNFSRESFFKVLAHVHENKDKFLSDSFKISFPPGDKTPFNRMSLITIHVSFVLFGYLLRVAESFFYSNELKEISSIINILQKQDVSLDKRKVIAVNYLLENTLTPAVGFDSLSEDSFLVDKKLILDIFDEDILLNINNIINVRPDIDLDLQLEKFFKSAKFGYCSKIIEEQMSIINLDN
jgi:hypothetical protein